MIAVTPKTPRHRLYVQLQRKQYSLLPVVFELHHDTATERQVCGFADISQMVCIYQSFAKCSSLTVRGHLSTLLHHQTDRVKGPE